MRFGTPQRDVVVVSNGSGAFDIIAATAGEKGGIAGRMTASVAIDIPGVTFSGTFSLEINTTARTRTVGPADIVEGITVTGLAVTLEVAGQRLTGSFSFQKNATTGLIQIGLKDVALTLGNGTTTFVTVTVASGAILVVPAQAATMTTPATTGGIAARLTGSISLNPSLSSSLSFDSGAVEVVLNTTQVAVNTTVKVGMSDVSLDVPAGPYVRVQVGASGSPARLTVMGQSISGVVVLEQRTTAAGTKVVRLAFTEVSLFLGDPGPSAATSDDTGLVLTDGAGAFILSPAGVAGSIEGTIAFRGLPVSVTARLTFQLNNLSVAVNEAFQFGGVDVVTVAQGTASTSEVQNVYVNIPDGTFTLGIDVNGSGRIDAAEISSVLEVGATATQVDSALEALYGSGDNVTVVAITGGYAVTWNGTGNKAPIAPNVRLLSLPRGPFVRVVANDIDITIFTDPTQTMPGDPGVTIHADVAFDKATDAGGHTVTRIAFANASISSSESVGGENPGLKNASGALIIFSPGATTQTSPATTAPTGGIAGLLTGEVSTGSGSFITVDASVGFSVNTTGVDVDQTIDLGSGGTITVKASGASTFQFVIQDLDFDFGDFLEIHGDFAISGSTFAGTGLEIFIGKGPGWNADGTINPDAIGVRITSAEVLFINDAPNGYALHASGNLALVGLDGLDISGLVTFDINTSTNDLTPPTGVLIPSGRFVFQALNVVIQVPGVVRLGGTLGLTRAPDGTLDITLAQASVLVTVSGTDVVRLAGYGAFSISPITGFRLVSFKVDDFAIFPQNATAGGTPGATAPTLFPTADLAAPLRNAVVTPVQVATSIDVVFNDVNGVGLRENTITDADQEFDIVVSTGATITVNGIPTKVAGKINTWRYSFTGNLPANGVVTVKFRAGGVTDLGGSSSMAEEERFYLFSPVAGQLEPGPIATLASPASGGTITAGQLNAQRYIDVTYTSLDGTPIMKSSLEVAAAPFTLTGPGVTTDLRMGSGSHPYVVGGAPMLVSGLDATATTVTYRYFLKDVDTQNATPMFTTGQVIVTFDAGAFSSVGSTTHNVNAAGLSAVFTIDASAPGEKTSGGPINLGPLTLQGPSVGIADFGFADGMVVLTIAVGVDAASLAFGGTQANPTANAAQQTESGVTVDLIGILGTFDLAVDVFGLLSGNVRVEPTGKWSLRVASLTAHIPNVADLSAGGIVVGYDPAGGDDQELVRVNTATVTFPRFGISGSLTPYDPSSHSNITANNDDPIGDGVIPGLVVRSNGFSLGTAQLTYKPGATSGNTVTPTSGSTNEKISFGGIVVLDDIRVGVSGLTVTFDGSNPFANFTGEVFFATGGAQIFPGKPFSASLLDRNTADDKNADGSANTEAFKIAVHFTGGKADAFQLSIDTLELKLSSSSPSAPPTSCSTRAPPARRTS